MATKTVAETLRIKPHTSFWSSHPEHAERIGTMPEGVTHTTEIDQAITGVIFVENEASAREILNDLKDQLDKPRVLWVAFPHGDTSGFDRETLGPILEEHRRRPVSRPVTIDDTWAAMRFGRMKPGEQPSSTAANDDSPSDLPDGLSAPARRALSGAGIRTRAFLARHTEKEVLALHGIGPSSIPTLRAALADAGLTFAERMGE